MAVTQAQRNIADVDYLQGVALSAEVQFEEILSYLREAIIDVYGLNKTPREIAENLRTATHMCEHSIQEFRKIKDHAHGVIVRAAWERVHGLADHGNSTAGDDGEDVLEECPGD